MDSYPETQSEFNALIASGIDCQRYLASIRWPNGFICPSCCHPTAWKLATGEYKCMRCRKRVTVTAGTLFQDTRYPLQVWFQAIWYLVSQKNGVSALGIQRILGLGSYHTAWAWLHRMRRAMVRPDRDNLSGTVEVDETYWGASQTGKRGRGATGKIMILVAVEHTGNKLGRLRLLRIPDFQGKTLELAIQTTVKPGSIIETDGLQSYNGVASKGYTHRVVRVEAIDDLLPHVHLVVSLLKRWLLGTHQGGVQTTHLDYYLDEFTFRFNRRNSHSRGMLFHRILEYAVLLPPMHKKDLRATIE
jgi:transposase-like protein